MALVVKYTEQAFITFRLLKPEKFPFSGFHRTFKYLEKKSMKLLYVRAKPARCDMIYLVAPKFNLL
jgi:hypothetical protein